MQENVVLEAGTDHSKSHWISYKHMLILTWQQSKHIPDEAHKKSVLGHLLPWQFSHVENTVRPHCYAYDTKDYLDDRKSIASRLETYMNEMKMWTTVAI